MVKITLNRHTHFYVGFKQIKTAMKNLGAKQASRVGALGIKPSKVTTPRPWLLSTDICVQGGKLVSNPHRKVHILVVFHTSRNLNFLVSFKWPFKKTKTGRKKNPDFFFKSSYSIPITVNLETCSTKNWNPAADSVLASKKHPIFYVSVFHDTTSTKNSLLCLEQCYEFSWHIPDLLWNLCAW